MITVDDITMESLTGHFEEKFRPSRLSVNKDTTCTSKSCMEDAERMVDMRYQNIKGKIYNAEFITLNTQCMLKYMGRLNRGCAPGTDGISAEYQISTPSIRE